MSKFVVLVGYIAVPVRVEEESLTAKFSIKDGQNTYLVDAQGREMIHHIENLALTKEPVFIAGHDVSRFDPRVRENKVITKASMILPVGEIDTPFANLIISQVLESRLFELVEMGQRNGRA